MENARLPQTHVLINHRIDSTKENAIPVDKPLLRTRTWFYQTCTNNTYRKDWKHTNDKARTYFNTWEKRRLLDKDTRHIDAFQPNFKLCEYINAISLFITVQNLTGVITEGMQFNVILILYQHSCKEFDVSAVYF